MHQGRVLLADNHLNLLPGIHSLLQTQFSAVVMVADEGSLMETVELVHPDLVIVDLSLPGKGGGNVGVRLKGSYPALPIIVLSVHDEPAVARLLLEAGIGGFVLKREVAQELIPAIREVLSGRTYLAPALKQQLPDL
jgi:DNA-binding NarL/FixJ family response regulator